MEIQGEKDNQFKWILSQEKLDDFQVFEKPIGVIVNDKPYNILPHPRWTPSIIENMKVIHKDGRYIITIVYLKISLESDPSSILNFPVGEPEERIRWTACMPPFEALEVHYQPLSFSLNGKKQFIPHDNELEIDTIERFEMTQKNGVHIVSGEFKQLRNDESGAIKKDDTCQVFDGKMSWSASVRSTEALGKSLKNYGLDWIKRCKWFSNKETSKKSRTILRWRKITKPDGQTERILEWITIYE